MPFQPLDFVVVENRRNETIANCEDSCRDAGVNLHVIAETEAGCEYEAFREAYRHMSTNSKDFELICFRRYFLLGKWLATNDVQRFVLIDSDTLLFRGIEQHLNELCQGEDFVGSRVRGESEIVYMLSPHISYWTRCGLGEFLTYLNRAYLDPVTLSKLEQIEKYFTSRDIPGGVTDMALLYLWATAKGAIKTTNAIRNGAAIDHNISVADNEEKQQYRTVLGFKRIFFDGPGVYSLTTDGRRVHMLALHFQGKSKLGMKAVLERKKMKYLLAAGLVTYSRLAKGAYYKSIGKILR